MVVLYLSSDQGDGNFASYTVNGESKTGGATQDYGEYGGWIEDGNLLRFITQGPTINIRVAARDGSTRGSLAGFQILDPLSAAAPAPPITLFEINPVTGTYSLAGTAPTAPCIEWKVWATSWTGPGPKTAPPPPPVPRPPSPDRPVKTVPASG